MPPGNQKRQKIVHDFAKSTAQSALRSGAPVKAGEKIYRLIDSHADLSVLFDTSRVIGQKEFDDWHENTITEFCEVEPALKKLSQVGWAAKIINVYLKTRVYLAGEGRNPPVAKMCWTVMALATRTSLVRLRWQSSTRASAHMTAVRRWLAMSSNFSTPAAKSFDHASRTLTSERRRSRFVRRGK